MLDRGAVRELNLAEAILLVDRVVGLTALSQGVPIGVVRVRRAVRREHAVARVVGVRRRRRARAGRDLRLAVAHGVVGERFRVRERPGDRFAREPVDAVVAVLPHGPGVLDELRAFALRVEGVRERLHRDGRSALADALDGRELGEAVVDVVGVRRRRGVGVGELLRLPAASYASE